MTDKKKKKMAWAFLALEASGQAVENFHVKLNHALQQPQVNVASSREAEVNDCYKYCE